MDEKTLNWVARQVEGFAKDNENRRVDLGDGLSFDLPPMTIRDLVKSLNLMAKTPFSHEELTWKYTVQEGDKEQIIKEVAAQLAAEGVIPPIRSRRAPKKRREVPADVAEWIAENALGEIRGQYKYYYEDKERAQGRWRPHEPALTPSVVADTLRGRYGPDEWRFVDHQLQTKWTERVLKALVKRGDLVTSICTSPRTKRRATCYEPA